MPYSAGFVLQGFHCGEGSSKPEPCPEGTYSNKKGLSGPAECSPCGRGFCCAAPGQTGPSGPCQAGFFCQGRALTPVSLTASFSHFLIVFHRGVFLLTQRLSRATVLHCTHSRFWCEDPQRLCDHFIVFPLYTNIPLTRNVARFISRCNVQWV